VVTHTCREQFLHQHLQQLPGYALQVEVGCLRAALVSTTTPLSTLRTLLRLISL
jgi:hypothetical protein